MTAKQWRDANPDKKGNIRDYSDINHLLVLANMESYNAILIEQGKPQSERLQILRNTAVSQLTAIAKISIEPIKKLK